MRASRVATLAALVAASGCSVLTDLSGLAGDAGGDGDVDALADAQNYASCGDAAARTALANAVYVHGSMGIDDSACGPPQRPCATIGYALTRAVATGAPAVYVSPGTFSEHLDLVNGVDVEGAWLFDGGWTAACDTTLTVVQGTMTDRTVSAAGITGAVLRMMTVESPAATSAGQSVYGMVLENASVTLDSVVVSADLGGAGLAGATSTAVGPNNCTSSSSGAAGEAGTPGGPGFDAGGYAPVPSSSGTSGTQGSYELGGAGQCGTCDSCQLMSVVLGDAGLEGGPDATCLTVPMTECASNGGPGCGGGGGGGGQGGGNGGASIAVYVVGASSHLTVRSGALITQGGGGGGAGGAGAEGGVGTVGTPSPSLACSTGCSLSCMPAPGSLEGGAGGVGGGGGNGGSGGGGAGGPTYLVLTFGGATATLDPSCVLQVGKGGTGGAPNGPNGESKTVASK